MEQPNSTDSDVYLNGSKGVKRTTIFLTESLDENLEALSLTSGDAKGVIIRRALFDYLETLGMQPHKKPKVSISY